MYKLSVNWLASLKWTRKLVWIWEFYSWKCPWKFKKKIDKRNLEQWYHFRPEIKRFWVKFLSVKLYVHVYSLFLLSFSRFIQPLLYMKKKKKIMLRPDVQYGDSVQPLVLWFISLFSPTTSFEWTVDASKIQEKTKGALKVKLGKGAQIPMEKGQSLVYKVSSCNSILANNSCYV